jgi:hypothetical protein
MLDNIDGCFFIPGMHEQKHRHEYWVDPNALPPFDFIAVVMLCIVGCPSQWYGPFVRRFFGSACCWFAVPKVGASDVGWVYDTISDHQRRERLDENQMRAVMLTGFLSAHVSKAIMGKRRSRPYNTPRHHEPSSIDLAISVRFSATS